jgi:predicted nucleotidyltransferase
MDKRESIKIAQRYIDEVRARYDISRALLFGSFAKGNYHIDSDIDIAIIFKNVNNLFDTQVELMQLRSNSNLQIEPHAFRESEFISDNPLAYEVMQNHVELSV